MQEASACWLYSGIHPLCLPIEMARFFAAFTSAIGVTSNTPFQARPWSGNRLLLSSLVQPEFSVGRNPSSRCYRHAPQPFPARYRRLPFRAPDFAHSPTAMFARVYRMRVLIQRNASATAAFRYARVATFVISPVAVISWFVVSHRFLFRAQHYGRAEALKRRPLRFGLCAPAHLCRSPSLIPPGSRKSLHFDCHASEPLRPIVTDCRNLRVAHLNPV